MAARRDEVWLAWVVPEGRYDVFDGHPTLTPRPLENRVDEVDGDVREARAARDPLDARGADTLGLLLPVELHVDLREGGVQARDGTFECFVRATERVAFGNDNPFADSWPQIAVFVKSGFHHRIFPAMCGGSWPASRPQTYSWGIARCSAVQQGDIRWPMRCFTKTGRPSWSRAVMVTGVTLSITMAPQFPADR